MLSRHQLTRLRRADVGVGGHRLRFAMDMLQLTQKQLEAASGVTQANISKLLLGKGSRDGITLGTLQKLSGAFGCSIEDLFPVEGRKEALAS